MPTYEYRCTSCGYDFDVVQRFTDKPLTACPKCGAELRKVFNPVGIVFKGSGFYSTDNHSAGAASAPAAKTEAETTTPAAGADGVKTAKDKAVDTLMKQAKDVEPLKIPRKRGSGKSAAS